jgi:hypothetical protein
MTKDDQFQTTKALIARFSQLRILPSFVIGHLCFVI